ncbi:MAG: DUF1566 domain-containing protein [Burkholderiales bacterium]|nr:DUF1566 domain-containing protein [Burkholderiales bacterium]
MKTTIIKLILLLNLFSLGWAANIAYVAKVGPGDTAAVGAGKQWPTTSFVADSSGQCLTDQLTGLMWAKNSSLLGTGSWGASTSPGTAQYKVAQMNSMSSAKGYHLCGYGDWRLPNINELASLINYKDTTSPASWLNTNGFSNVVQAYRFWSSSTDASNTDRAWVVLFNFGPVNANNKTSNNYVWPVRGGK